LPSHPNKQRQRKFIIPVLDTAAEISLMSEGIVEDLLRNGLRAPQLPVVNGAVVRAFRNGTKKVKRLALFGFEIDGGQLRASVYDSF